MPEKIIFRTDWIKIKETPRGFQFLERKGKDSVAIFLIRHKSSGTGYEVLVRYQPLPIDNSNMDQKLYPCPITGGLEIGESTLRCALREVEEEAGYILTDLRDLGFYVTGTQTNEIVYIYWFDVTLMSPECVRGDGTYHESISYNKWEDIHNLKDYNYSACQIGYYRLKARLGI